MDFSLLFPPVKTPTTEPSNSNNHNNNNNNNNNNSTTAKPPFAPPGHVAFRLLCRAARVGGLIGKSGTVVNHLQQLTNSRIRVDDPPEATEHRVISVVSSSAVLKRIKLEEEWFNVSSAQECVVRVFERVLDVIDGVVLCRLLVLRSQAGCVIGKGGKAVEKIRNCTGTRIRVLASDEFASVSMPGDEAVEIEGDVMAVKKALVAVTGRIQEFLPLEKPTTYGSQILPPNSANQGIPSSLESEKFSSIEAEIVFKMLCPNELVGGIIGPGGSIVKALQNETGASISISPSLPECDERLVIITATENVESQYSPVQKAAILVFNRCGKALYPDSKGSGVCACVVVASNQVGCLLGKGGSIISEMRKETGAFLRIIGGNQVPKCASYSDEVLQITGELVNVQDALYKVTGRLRDNTFLSVMSTGSGNRNSLSAENNGYGRVRDSPLVGSNLSVVVSENHNELKSLTRRMDHLGISNDIDQSPPSSSSLVNIWDVSRRLPSVKGGVGVGRSAVVTYTTIEIVVPDHVIYGDNGSNLYRLRQISGAKVVVHEPHPGTTQRIVVISGTPDETQAAQSLLQAFLLTVS